MKPSKAYLLIWGVLFMLNSVSSQTLYPVMSTGNMAPPFSNNLTDYSNQLSQNLNYVFTLNDPVELSVDVYFSLTIKNKGRVIMKTKSNFVSGTTTLSKNIPFMVSGSQIADLLEVQNLQGVNGFQASNILPNGQNQICLEAYSTIRNIPISQSACGIGFYNKVDVPVLELPRCDTKIEAQSSNQNIFFKWAPRHIGSMNVPPMIQYEYSLVELPLQYDNLQDGFTRGTPIAKKITSVTNLYYTNVDPILEQSKKYVWRVKVFDPMGTDVFKNNGFSEYCEFSLKSGSVLDVPSCSSGLTTIPPFSNEDKVASTLTKNEIVKIGYFDMQFTELTPAGSGYNGQANIEVPFLKATIPVTFSGLKSNKDRRVYEVESVSVKNDVDTKLSTINANSDFITKSKAVDESITQLIQSDPSSRMTMNRNSSDKTPIGLPLIISEKDSYGKSLPSVIIFDINFSANGAKISAAISSKTTDDDKKANYLGFDIPTLPGGIAPNQLLDLVSDLNLKMGLGGSIEIKQNSPESNATKAKIGCSGFQEFLIKGEYSFPKNFININDKDKPLTAVFSAKTKFWDQTIFELSQINPFEIEGLTDFKFSIEGGFLDIASSDNESSMDFPEGYTGSEENWKGIYIPKIKVELPKSLTGDNVKSFESENFLLDKEGVHARLIGNNILGITEGSIGGWAMSMDTIELNIQKNALSNSSIKGGMRLPIMKGEESMPYVANMSIPENGTKYDLDFKAVPKAINIELLGANIEFSDDSEITVGRKDGEFLTPKLKMSGKVIFDFSPKGMVGKSAKAYKEIEKVFKDNGLGDLVPKFKSEGFDFNNFIFDSNRPNNKFTVDNIRANATKLEFLGTTADLSTIKFEPVDKTDLDSLIIAKLNDDDKVIGFSFETKVAQDVLGGLAPTVFLGLNIKESILPDSSSAYGFLNFNVKMKAPNVDMSCNKDMEEVEISTTDPYNGSTEDLTEIKVGRFTLKPDMTSMSNSGGSLTGTGIIEVPVLGPMRLLRVKFDNVKINSDKQLIEGSITTESGSEGLISSPDIKGLLGDATKKLNDQINSNVKLPVILGDPKKDGYAFTIVGLEFTSNKTSLAARLIVDMGNDKYIEFKAEGLDIVPTGIAGVDLRLSLDKKANLSGSSIDFPLSIDAYNAEDKSGSYVLCDCDGFQSFNLSGDIKLPTDYVKSLKGKSDISLEQVTGKFSMNAEKWGDFMGKVSINDSIYIPEIEDMPMYMSEVEFDFSDDRNPSGLKLDNQSDTDSLNNVNEWKGIYISTMSLKLPEAITSTTTDEVAMVTGNDLIFNKNGFSGVFTAENLISLDKANIAGFGFSLDSIVVELKENGLEESRFIGGIQLPVMEKKESIPYIAKMSIGNDTVTKKKFLDFNFEAKPGIVKIDLLKSKFNFNESSSISITRENGEFKYPIVDLSGTFQIEIPDLKESLGAEFAEQAQLLEEHLGISNIVPKFNLDSIAFEHFKINPNDTVAFSIESITPNGVGINFMSMDWNMDKIEFDEIKKLVEDAKEGVKELALEFNFGKAPLSADLKIKVNEEKGKDNKLNYKFAGIDFKLNLPSIPKFKCAIPDSVATLEETSGTISAGDVVKVGGFNMKVNELDGTKGNGTINIDFLNYDMEVTFDGLTVNAKQEMLEGVVLTSTDKSLIPDEVANTDGKEVPFIAADKLKDISSKAKSLLTLPISIAEKLKQVAGLELPEGLDIIIVGLSFSKLGGQMNLVISTPSPIEDQDPLQFGIRGLNIRPDGMNLGDLKLFLAKDVQF